MFWNKKKEQDAHNARVQSALHSQDFADSVIAKVESQEIEVVQVVDRLETRARRNHFGEALELAMQRKSE